MTIPPGFRKFPQPPRKPMTLWEHKAQMDYMAADTEMGDDILHELLCAVYPNRDQQNA